ncbi:MAG: DUF3784 domain-containing protein [Gillisia sp.]
MILTSIIFLVLGILVKYAKLYFLIAGYNTMSNKKKADYDIEGISAVFGNSFIGMALLMMLGLLISNWLENPDIAGLTFAGSLLIGIPYLLIKINSDRYKRGNGNK